MSGSQKCSFGPCTRLVGPIRLRVSKMCYQCDRSLEEWSKKGFNARVEWKRRCELSVARQDALPKGAVTDRDVKEHVRTLVFKRKKEEAKK